MDWNHWLAFTAASTLLVIMPGPTVLLVVSYALSHGRRAARATVAGVALGDFTSMTASMLGLGALLAASATLFTVLKWVGGAYLIYMGIKLWRAPVGDVALGKTEESSPRRIFLHTYLVTATNPKGIIFFVAFLPQFLDTTASLIPQLLICEATFLVLATANAALYGLLAAGARRAIHKTTVQRWVNRAGGTLLVAAGAAAILVKRS